MKKKSKNNFSKLIYGACIGIINGVFGGGGGMLCVPLLKDKMRANVKISHATTVLIILPVCLTSSFVYWTSGNFEFFDQVPTILGVVVGGVIGSIALKKFNNEFVSLLFSIVMIFAGIRSITL